MSLPELRVTLLAGCGLYRDALGVAMCSAGVSVMEAPALEPASKGLDASGPLPDIACVLPAEHEHSLWAVVDGLCRVMPSVQRVHLARPGEPLDEAQVLQHLHGLLCADVSVTQLVASLREIHAGRRIYESACMRARDSSGVCAAGDQSILSARELELLEFIAQGYRSRDIARRLQLSEKTVATYRMRMVKKLGIHEQHELVRYARELCEARVPGLDGR